MNGFLEPQSFAWDSNGDSNWFEQQLCTVYANARTLVYEYPWPKTQTALIDTIHDASKNLVFALAKLDPTAPPRSSNPWTGYTDRIRPVLFVCHNFGGMIVKNALLSAANQNDKHSLARRTFGLLCLKTPHGSTVPAWEEALRSMPVSSESNSLSHKNTHKTDHLGWARKINPLGPTDGSSRSLRKRRILGLYELLSSITRDFRPVASLYSSVDFCCDDHNCSHDSAIVLHENCLWSMTSVSRIPQYGELHYKTPVSLSQNVAKTTVEAALLSMAEFAATQSRERYYWVSQQEALKDLYSEQRLYDTGRWLLELRTFRAWMSGEGTPVLWLCGSSGTGKSTICSTLIDIVRNREKQSGVSFFCFFDDGLGAGDPARYFLRTFVCQLEQHQPLCVPEPILRSILKSLDQSSALMTMKLFADHLESILANVRGQIRITLFMDGFDDKEDWINKLVAQAFVRLNHSLRQSIPFRCYISSSSQCPALTHRNHVTQIKLDGHPGVQRDVERFVWSRLEEFSQEHDFERRFVNLAAKELCSRANGIFLWAALAVEEIILRDLLAGPEHEIKMLPSSVRGLYQRRLTAIPSSDLEKARNIFAWLIGAMRLLRVSDLDQMLEVRSTAFSTTYDTKFKYGGSKPRLSQPDVNRICGHLIVFSNCGIARLRHPSLRNHILSKAETGTSEDRALDVHEIIAKTCLEHLLRSAKGHDVTLFSIQLLSPHRPCQSSPTSTMTDYLVNSWTFHYRLAENHSRVLAGTLQRHFAVTLDSVCELLSIKRSQRWIQVVNTTLRVSAHCGFPCLAKMVLEMGCDPDAACCKLCDTPLAIAFTGGSSNKEVLKLLLQKGATATSHAEGRFNQTLLIAASQGLVDAVELNLMRGANANSVDVSGQTPLHIAARLGDIKIIKLLMQHDVNLNSTTSDTSETPLHIAATYGNLGVVKYLVDGKEASPNEVDLYRSIAEQQLYQDWTENLLADDFGNRCILWEMDARDLAEQKLQELSLCSTRYADINRKRPDGLTALHLAASKGSEDIVQYLLARGATGHLSESAEHTALQKAAENGHLETVRLLIQAGANVKPSIIRIASVRGHHDVAGLLRLYSFNSEITGKSAHWPTVLVATKSDFDALGKTNNKRRNQEMSSWTMHGAWQIRDRDKQG